LLSGFKKCYFIDLKQQTFISLFKFKKYFRDNDLEMGTELVKQALATPENDGNFVAKKHTNFLNILFIFAKSL